MSDSQGSRRSPPRACWRSRASRARRSPRIFAGGQLTALSDAADPITVACVGGKVEVNSVAITGNPNRTAITGVDVAGGPGANAINLAAVNETDFTDLDTVTVDGGGAADTINGSQLADLLKGGEGNDRMIGDNNPGGTRDDMRGQDGDDQLVWNPGDGDDINEGGAGSDTAEVNGGGKDQFEVAPSAAPGIASPSTASSPTRCSLRRSTSTSPTTPSGST